MRRNKMSVAPCEVERVLLEIFERHKVWHQKFMPEFQGFFVVAAQLARKHGGTAKEQERSYLSSGSDPLLQFIA